MIKPKYLSFILLAILILALFGKNQSSPISFKIVNENQEFFKSDESTMSNKTKNKRYVDGKF